MFPVIFHLGPFALRTHDFFVVLGVATAVGVLWLRSNARSDQPPLAALVAGGLFSGAVFAKLGTGWQYLMAADGPSLAGLWLHGGQSVLGGLGGAYVGVLLTKRLIGHNGSTGDWFAPAVAAGLAVGRVGCFLTEQVGTPTTLPWGISVTPDVAATMPYCPSCAAGVPMHPSFLYEIAFHLIAFLVLMRLSGQLGKPGDSFKAYLLAYALFRFSVEFVRDNPEMALGMSGSQLFLVATVPLGVVYFVWLRVIQPKMRLEAAV
ncbi:MAG TPA: prolipoprotein diacylglyceryl transferase family protein [Acidimicrobiia bacterium]|nr:prolipoprotein diacylglyceryl transferase family protein [Acidimicrobiia bacterium]